MSGRVHGPKYATIASVSIAAAERPRSTGRSNKRAQASAASRDAAEACARLFERPVERGLSAAAMETLAIVAYFGPCTRPDIARIRGIAADSVVAGLVERGLIAEAGRDAEAAGAIRYKTTPLFERVFGLESLAALPRLDDLGGEADVIRERLEAVAEKRPA